MAMSTVNRWGGLITALVLFILIPFVILEKSIHHAFTQVVSSGSDQTWFAGFIALLLAADLILPIPSSIVSTTAGAVLGFIPGTVTCWIGMSLGCLMGYWLGSAAGVPVVRNIVGEQELEKANHLGRRYGMIFLIFARAVPVLAEISVMTAGLMRVPPRVFFIVTSLSNFGISVAYASVGAFAHQMNSLPLAVAGGILIPGLAILLARTYFHHELPDTSYWMGWRTEKRPVLSRLVKDVVEQRFSVSYTYPVYFTEGVFDPDNPLLARTLSSDTRSTPQKCVVFIDDGVMASWPHLISDIETYAGMHNKHLHLISPPISVPGGEKCKNDPAILQTLYGKLFEWHVDRHSCVMAIGGGAVLDAVGYAAATAHRGIRFVRLPTTVLAQNDSGVGVKTGVNLFQAKNFIGAFAPPYAVLNDYRFLTTLSHRDRLAGMAEAVKVALIKDRDFFEWLESHAQALRVFDGIAVSTMIRRCAELHMRHSAESGDPFETGNVRPLDYGHWAAHKLESLSGHELRHGEAVAIGMTLDARYAAQIGLLAKEDASRIFRLLENLGFVLWHPMMQAHSAEGTLLLIHGLEEFREHLGGPLSVTLLTQIGRFREVKDMDCREIEKAISWLQNRYGPT